MVTDGIFDHVGGVKMPSTAVGSWDLKSFDWPWLASKTYGGVVKATRLSPSVVASYKRPVCCGFM